MGRKQWVINAFVLIFLVLFMGACLPEQSPPSPRADIAPLERVPAEKNLPPSPTGGSQAAEAIPETGPERTSGVQKGAWVERASMPTARSEMAAAVVDGRIYVPGGFGGPDALEVYDPLEDAWQSLSRMPEGRHHMLVAALDGKIYVLGGAAPEGWEPTSSAWVYDPATDEWSSGPSMPEARLGGAAVALDGRVYVVGGVGGTNELLSYQPAEGIWQRHASLRQPREHVSAVALDGKIYALGGRWSGIGELDAVEVYDPASDSWSLAGRLNEARAGFAAAVLGGKILVVGGEVIMHGRETLSTLEIFDPETGVSSPGPSTLTPVHGVAVAVVDESLFLLGGSDRAGAIENAGRVMEFRSDINP